MYALHDVTTYIREKYFPGDYMTMGIDSHTGRTILSVDGGQYDLGKIRYNQYQELQDKVEKEVRKYPELLL